MLLAFRVRNYASLRDEQELNLTGSDGHDDQAVGQGTRTDSGAMPVAAIYGANASGKSNVIKAFRFAVEAIMNSHQRWLPNEPIPRWPFRLDDHSAEKTTSFGFEFVLDEVRYEYAFSLNDTAITEEWLYAWPRGKRQALFRRNGNDVIPGRQLGGNKATIREVMRPNSLFLSAGAANNHEFLGQISQYFSGRQMRVHERLHQHRNREQRFNHVALNATRDPQLMDLIKYADLGIVGSVEQSPITDLDELNKWLAKDERAAVREASDEVDMDHLLSRLSLVQKPTVAWLHEAEPSLGAVPLPAAWESSGTVEWMFLANNALAMLRAGGTLLVDDLGADLHPALVAHLVRLFLEPSTNPRGAQLVFNTHDATLLWRGSEARLRRDQIWFTTKSQDGATSLYPLTDFRARDNADDYMGRYLHGRYEAVPFFEDELLGALRHDLQS